ncbi:MAG TPA: septal ring lytic transglycosylase RlpA family protein [Acetobacteraceae bacterium]
MVRHTPLRPALVRHTSVGPGLVRHSPVRHAPIRHAALRLIPGQRAAHSPPSVRDPAPDARHQPAIETGAASYYGQAHEGRRTASGQRFEETALTAAHPWLPFGTKVRITLLSTGQSVVVEITDRLYSSRRIVDLSLGAARALGMVRQGVAIVALSPR